MHIMPVLRKHTIMAPTLQVIMGRKFEGPAAFIPTPKVVTFRDFDVGQTYRQIIILTNVSLGRDTFKVGPNTA